MRKWIPALLTALLLFCAACAAPQTDTPEGPALYYLADTAENQGSDAIAAEYCDVELPTETAAAAEQLLARYWEGPESESLASPLPAGLQLLSVETQGGRVTLDVSGQYGALTGVELTLADSCLTMTLLQLPGVYSVEVLVRGRSLEYRGKDVLRQRDVLLSTTEDLVGTVRAAVWYADGETGALSAVTQTIPVYEGQTRAESVLEAMREPPAEELRALLPEDFAFLSVRLEEDVCYVNLPGEGLAALNGEESLLLTAAARSLCSLPQIVSVRYLVDGESAVRYGAARVDELYNAES